MTVKLTSNFFANARGLTLLDGGGITWSINTSTNAITANGAGAGAGGTVTSIGSTTLTIAGTSAIPTVNLSAGQVANIAAGGTAVQPGSAPALVGTNFSGTAASLTVGNATSAVTSTNLAGGLAGSVPYQTGVNTTAMLAIGSAGKVLTVNAGATAPQWTAQSSLIAGGLSATLVVGSGGSGVTGPSLGAANGVVLGDAGTFTPTAFGGTTAGVTTYSNQGGKYSRIGDRCFFNLFVSWTGATGTGQLVIGGLPFAANAGTLNYSAVSIRYTGTDTAQSYYGFIAPGGAVIFIESHIGTVGEAAVALPAAGTMIISGQYAL